MSDIFVSYSREDKERVKPLVDALISHGYDVWWDRALVPGDQFEAKIDKEILRARCVLVVWSRHSVNSTWVKNEALEGQDRDILVPVHIDEVRTAVAFRQSQGASLLEWPKHAEQEEFDGLLKAIAAKVGDEPSPDADFAIPQKKNWLPAIVLGFICLLIAGTWITYQSGISDSAMDKNNRITLAILPFESAESFPGIGSEIYGLLREIQSISVVNEVAIRDLSSNRSPAEVASKLSVRFLLLGKVINAEDRQSLVVTLLDSKSSNEVWSESYILLTDNFSKLRNEVTKDLVDALDIDLDIRSRQRLNRTISDNNAAYRSYLLAQDLLRRADLVSLNLARDAFLQAVELDRGFAEAYSGLCRSYLGIYEEQRDSLSFENAERACHRALTLDSENSRSYLALGLLYDASGQYDDAEIELRKTLELDPENADALTGMGLVLSALDRYGEAEEVLQRALSIQRGYWKTHNSLGVFYFQQGSFQKAKENFYEVTYLAPANVTAWINLGTARYFLGEFDQALAAWQQANDLQSDPSSLSNIGSALFFLRRFDEAAEMFRQAVALAPEDHRWWGNLGDALSFVDEAETEKSEAYLKAIDLAITQLAIKPDDVFTTSRLAVYYAAVNDVERGVEMIKQASTEASSDMNVYYSFAVAYSLMKKRTESDQFIKKALENGYLPILVESDPMLQPLD